MNHYILPNIYRIGDAVAVYELCSLIEMKRWPVAWYLRHPNRFLQEIAYSLMVAPAGFSPSFRPESEAPPESEIFNDTNLWIWNDVFRQIEHRVDFIGDGDRLYPYEIVFAPLLEVGYSEGRAMHPRFVEEVCKHLGTLGVPVAVLIDEPNVHDWHWLARTDVTLIRAPLAEAINIIGSAKLFIGGDTGFSHIAARFAEVEQIAIHSRADTERKINHTRSALVPDRETILAQCRELGLSVIDAEYRSFPNKSNCTNLLFDTNGVDIVDKVKEEITRIMIT